MKPIKSYKGKILLFGIFHIKKRIELSIHCSKAPELYSKKRLADAVEPFLYKICTIKWTPSK